MDRKFEFSIGEFYHVYNRGNDKRSIFTNDADYLRFIKLLFLANNTDPMVMREIPIGRSYVEVKRGETLTAIGAYCLMPNHFHLLLQEKIEGGISSFLKKLCTSHSAYFNKKYSRTGTLFEGRFKAQHADTDEYLKYLFSYIHLNPVKLIDKDWKDAGIKDLDKARAHLANYKHSSYQDYVGAPRAESVILDPTAFPEYFETRKDLETHINDWLNYQLN
jgi:putative transposase